MSEIDLWAIEPATVQDITSATREKLNTTEEILTEDIADLIRSIPSQKPEEEKSVELTKNGTYTIEPEEGKVITKVTVTENNPYEGRWLEVLNRSITSISEEDIADVDKYGPYIFGHCYNLTHVPFPAHITSIGSRCFFACTKLGTTENLIIPATVKSIGEYAFGSCTGLTKVSIRGKPDSIAINAFSNCGNIAHAYVSWGPGEVANEPWGLSETKCQMHWNYGS